MGIVSDYDGTLIALALYMRLIPRQSDKKPPIHWIGGVVLLGLLASPAVSLAGYQSHDSIRSTVTSFVERELGGSDTVEVELGHLDRRLKLHECGESLEAFWPNGSKTAGRGVVGVRCTDAKPWKMYVQVNLHVYKDIAVLQSSKVRGEALSREDIIFERRNISGMGDKFLTDVSSVLGYEVKRSLNPSTVLHARLFKAPRIIVRGQRVVLLAVAAGIEVKMGGKALSDGVQGGVIKVKNLSSSRVVEGEVVDKGTVRIRF